MTNDKRSIRKHIRGLKKQFTDEELVEMSRPIISELLAHQAVNGAKTILMYYSLPDEVFTHDAINLLAAQGKTVLLPKVIDARTWRYASTKSPKTWLKAFTE